MCFRPLEGVQKSEILQVILCANLKHAYFLNFHTGEKKYLWVLTLSIFHSCLWYRGTEEVFFVCYRASSSDIWRNTHNVQSPGFKKKKKKSWKVCDIVQTNKMTLSRLKAQQLWIHQVAPTLIGWMLADREVWTGGVLLTVSLVTLPPSWHWSGGGETLNSSFLSSPIEEQRNHIFTSLWSPICTIQFRFQCSQ